MRIILLGAPGSGKGTQARKLAEKYKVPQISTGDILRAAIADGGKTGKEIEKVVKQGGLVPDATVIELVTERLQKSDTRRGFILDGFPRTIPQAQELDTRLGWVSRPIQMVVNFEVDTDRLLDRITARLTCKKCGEIFNLKSSPPKKKDKCDACGGKLVQRADDTKEAVEVRLEKYNTETLLLGQYYKAQHKLRTLDANGESEDIFSRLTAMIDTEVRPLENKVISVHGENEEPSVHTTIVGGKIVREMSTAEPRVTRVELNQSAEAQAPESRRNKQVTEKPAASRKSKKDSDQPAKAKPKAEQKVSKAKPAKPTDKKKAAPKTEIKSAKTAAKKTKASKVVASKASAAKKAAKKTTAKKATTKKKVASTSTKKKSVTRKTTKKVASKKAIKKAASKKVVKKAAPKVTKKVVKKKTQKPVKKTSKKQSVKKVAAKKTSAKKAPAKKTKAAKSVSKKVTKKSAGKKTAAKKTTRKARK